ncbi:pre-rRNA processing protein [Coemansia biformis]|uniref:Pre-rRNA processing protein n=1 Tax=Coemansia biformis TaxID=1286918 RepID=A0A9W8CYF9_9FUNG|nr:pre-rRNA processing protein [Coemansia biformis]
MDSGLEQQLHKLREQITCKAAHQQQHAAILLAVEETIKEQGAAAEPAGYFAALMTLLEQQVGAGSKANPGAITYLLSLILPHVSHAVLRAKFTTMMAVLSQSLDLAAADVALLRSVVACLETVLLAQDASSWRQPIAQGTFKSLLQLAIDSKPKVRRRAQEAVSALLARPPPPAAVHPAAQITSRFVLGVLGNTKADNQAAIHILQLVKQTEMVWPPSEFGELCAALMQLPRLNVPFLGTLSFQVLETMFASASESLDEDQFRDILIAAIDLKPSINDSMASEAWLRIVQKGYAAFASIGAEACFQSLPDLVDLIIPDIELGKQSTRDAATRCIWALIRQCIPDAALESDGMQQLIKTLATGLSYRYRESWALVFLLIAALFQRLGRHAHPSMDAIAIEVANMRMEPEFRFKDEADAVLGAAIRAVGPQAFLEIVPLNIDVGQRQGETGRAWLLPLMKSHIRNAPLGYFVTEMLPLADGLAAQSQKSAAKGREVESKVFDALSQQVWALLGGFCNVPHDIVDTFSPAFAERLANEMLEVPALRPAICGALQTLLTAVHTLAHGDIAGGPLTVQQALAAEQHLARFAPDYLSQLFNIFAQSPGAGRGYLMDTITAFLEVVTSSEVNATFVRVCTMLDKSLKAHKPPAPAELTERYLEAHPPPTAHTMVDLAVVMAPHLDAERLQMLTRAALMLVQQNEDAILQKKGYKALARLVEQPEGSAARQLIESSLAGQLMPMLAKSAETAAVSSRRGRLVVVSALTRVLADDQLHFIPAMLSEAIVSTKDSNERARAAAFDTLLAMGRRMHQGGVVNMAAVTGDTGRDGDGEMVPEKQASIEEYFKMIAAGLAAQTPHMISATIAALSRALFEFHKLLDSGFIVDLLNTVMMFVVHNNREIARASLGFVKVAAVALPKEVLMVHLGEIIPCILKWSHEFKNKLRLKCRHIMDRLARRLGLDAVAKATPEEHVKLIDSMRKKQQQQQQQRSQRPKESDAGQRPAADEALQGAAGGGKKPFGSTYEDIIYGSESELEDSGDEAASRAKKSKAARGAAGRRGEQGDGARGGGGALSGAWIKEDTDGPLDFLDRKAFTHFSLADPAARAAEASRRTRSAPKMKGGKLVFEDEEEMARKAKAAATEAGEGGGEGAAGEDYYVQSLKSKDGFYRTANQKIKFRKRQGGDSDDEMDVGSDDEGGKQGRAGAKKRSKGNSGAAYGREFRAKKAQGDVKRGNVDPYAYIPLNPRTMKKGAISVKGSRKPNKRGAQA